MDIIQRNGNYPVPPGASEILGVEFSGHVSALGEGVSKFKVNDEVFGIAGGVGFVAICIHAVFLLCGYQGAYAEYIAVNESHVLPKPSHLSWNEAASIPEVFLTGTGFPWTRRTTFSYCCYICDSLSSSRGLR